MSNIENKDDATIIVEGVSYRAHDVLVLKQDNMEARSLASKTISDMVRLAESTVMSGLTIDELQLTRLANLTGTPAFQALYIIDSLNKTAEVPGDVCEYGVATGRTSALIAATLRRKSNGKRLWLYDSFEGLPMPSKKDMMIHDLYGLGQMEKYEGMFAFPEDLVRRELQQVGFPSDNAIICKGWIEAATLPERSPELISFCYLDMDFYQSTKDVLTLLVQKMPKGGIAVADDYGFFSSGVKTAVEEIMREYPGAFSFNQPFKDKFVILTKMG